MKKSPLIVPTIVCLAVASAWAGPVGGAKSVAEAGAELAKGMTGAAEVALTEKDLLAFEAAAPKIRKWLAAHESKLNGVPDKGTTAPGKVYFCLLESFRDQDVWKDLGLSFADYVAFCTKVQACAAVESDLAAARKQAKIEAEAMQKRADEAPAADKPAFELLAFEARLRADILKALPQVSLEYYKKESKRIDGALKGCVVFFDLGE